jgi:hypothetical protein
MNLIGNFSEHPIDNRYTVFKHYSKEQSEYFKSLLEEKQIKYEYDEEFSEKGVRYLFGVKNKDLSKTKTLNYLTIAKFREPFIPNVYFRYIVMIISAIVMTLAIIGYIKSRN